MQVMEWWKMVHRLPQYLNLYFCVIVWQSCDIHVTPSLVAVSAHPTLYDGVCGGEAGSGGTGAGVAVPSFSGACLHPLQLGPLQRTASHQPKEEVSQLTAAAALVGRSR